MLASRGFNLNRTDLQTLAELRIDEATALMTAAPPRPDGAYYLAGYAVECALKAAIAKLNNQHDWPEKTFVTECHTHNILALVRLAGLEAVRKTDAAANPALAQNWLIVQRWSERSRYERHSRAKTQKMIDAVTDNVEWGASMDQGPLVIEQIDEGAKLASAFDKRTPLQAVFWLKESEDGEWFLYLASDQINDSNFDLAYGEVVRLLRPGSNMWLDTFQVKVTGSDDPIAKAVLAIQQKYPGKLATRLRNRMLGGVSVDEVYIYPFPVSVAA